MNSRIKQVQKERRRSGRHLGGLSYSVIKNALFKVIKLRGVGALGSHIVVQGGTFLNDATLRALEKITGREVIRPDIAGLMGAFGAALIARERYAPGTASTLSSARDVDAFTVRMTHTRCRGCENACLLRVNTFPGGRRHLSGNRCERGAGESRGHSALPKYTSRSLRAVFCLRAAAAGTGAPRVVGLPRALNMFENYPFWFTFFTELGFRVELSGVSSKKIFEKGLESIPPVRMLPGPAGHGHIMDLIERAWISYSNPCIPYEYKEQKKPITITTALSWLPTPKTSRTTSNLSATGTVRLLRPFHHLHDPEVLTRQLAESWTAWGFPDGRSGRPSGRPSGSSGFRQDIRRMGDEAMAGVIRGEYPGVVLVGRPYHVDEEIHHGIPGIVGQLGFAVFTEDSVSHMAPGYQPLRVLDQWMYHSRLYAAAHVVGQTAGLELVQLNSFGCGLDAITTDQVEEILKSYGKTYTLIKIDEGSNLGAARIRLRSLRAVVDERRRRAVPDTAPSAYHAFRPTVFGKHMTGYTVIGHPDVTYPFYAAGAFLPPQRHHAGHPARGIPQSHRDGLGMSTMTPVYPAIIVIGQLMEAIESGKYDLNRLAVMITQTGGSCRASNYMALLRKALRDAGLAHIPAISLNALGLEDHPGFRITPRFFLSAMMALLYGDLFQPDGAAHTAPMKKTPGAADALHRRWEQARHPQSPRRQPVPVYAQCAGHHPRF
jgi:predicted nucleotide-binding protein (sugar kinase/HSP70/actin superfamily)